MCGNWKMNLTVREAVELASELKTSLASVTGNDVMVAPPYPYLAAVATVLKGTAIHLGAQNMCAARSGAHTGEVSPLMLKDLGVEYVILGHSERRHAYGEGDVLINAKVTLALEEKLNVILCVGETWEERESGRMGDVILGQLREGLRGVHKTQFDFITIAYEPVWAIGTGKTATPDDAQDVHSLIRNEISAQFDPETAEKTRVLYGGSVKPDNIEGLMAKKDIDGSLVGGASLSAVQFVPIAGYRPGNT